MKNHPEIDVYGLLMGESPETGEETRSHADRCDTCLKEIEATGVVLEQLDSLPEISPSPAVWDGLERATRPRKGGWIPLSAAAALLLAVLAFLLVTPPDSRRVAATLADRSSLYIEETFSTETSTELRIPEVGSLRLKAGSEIRFATARTLVLIRGEVFAEVDPSGIGFEIRSGKSRAIVQGTRFGVKAGAAVYVFEGRVRVVGPGGDLELGSGEAATLLPVPLAEGLAKLDLRWIHASDLSVALDLVGDRVVPRGDEITWRVSLTGSPSLLPDDLRNLHGPDHYLFLRVRRGSDPSYLLPIDPEKIFPAGGARISFRIDSRKIRMDGRHQVFAIYTGKGTGGRQATSNPVNIEVRR